MSLARLFAAARAKSLVPFLFVGAVGSRASARWLSSSAPGTLGDVAGAGSPRQADLLVVVGEVSHKAAPVLQRLHARMADPSYVMWVRAHRATRTASYAQVADVAEILPLDVVIEGDPPEPEAVEAALVRLRERVRATGERP